MLDKLFKNPGKKIKLLAEILFVVRSVLVLIYAFCVFILSEDSLIKTSKEISEKLIKVTLDNGLSILFILMLYIVWVFVSSLLMYGFGTLVENSDTVVAACSKKGANPETAESEQEKQEKIETMKKWGLLSDEEYSDLKSE